VQRFGEWIPENNAGTADFLWPIVIDELDPKPFAGDGVDRTTDDQPVNEYFLLRLVSIALTEAQGIDSLENVRSDAGKH
jgi:hypothetical protein